MKTDESILIDYYQLIPGFPFRSDSKDSACNVGDLGSIPGLGISPGGGNGSSLQYSCLENPHGQRGLLGYSPWAHKKSDMTEQLSTASTKSIVYFEFPSFYIMPFFFSKIPLRIQNYIFCCPVCVLRLFLDMTVSQNFCC